MGRPAKSEALHEFHGTNDKSTLPRESAIAPGRPRFPKGISGEARVAFKRLVRALEERRHCTSGDYDLLRMYAIIYDRHARALEKLAVQGDIVQYVSRDKNGAEIHREKPNPYLRIAQDSEKEMLALLDRLGMHPLNRDKVKPVRKSPEEYAADTPGTIAYILKHGQEG